MTSVVSGSSLVRLETPVPRLAIPDHEIVYGREPEVRTVREMLRRAEQGTGGVVLVEGEPGAGKSLLLQQAIAEAAGREFSVAAGTADQLARALPFFALRRALGEPFTWTIDNRRDHGLPDSPAWWIGQIQAHLEERATATPVLVCLDDLQWASPGTLAALRLLPVALKRSPVVWLLARTSMAQHQTGYLFRLLEKEGADRLNLAPLDYGSVAALLTGTFGAPSDQALSALARGAAGNCALLAELARGLVDEDAVHVKNDRAVLVSSRLPGRVHRVAERRLHGLSKQAQLLLMTAAVLGASFRLEDAAEMLGETEASLLLTVEEATEAAIITAADNAFSFRHELLRRALCEVIPRPGRSALHRQYGRILLNRGEAVSLAGSHLLLAAHSGAPALLADLDSATMQTLRSTPQVAADLAVRALALTAPDDPGALSRALAATEALAAAGRLDQSARLAESTLVKPLPPVAEARLRCALSSVLNARGRAGEAAEQADMVLAQPHLPHDLREEALTSRLLALGGRPRDRSACDLANSILAETAEHESPATVAALVSGALAAWDDGQAGTAVGMLRDAARPGNGISPDARRPQPLLALSGALVGLRQIAEADRILEAADQPGLNDIPARSALLTLRARIHLANGNLRDGEALARAALSCAETLGADGYASAAHCVLALIALRRGEIAVASQHVVSFTGLLPSSLGLIAGGELTIVRGQIAEALDGPGGAMRYVGQPGADFPISRGQLLCDPVVAPWLVRAAFAAGDEHLATQVSARAVALAAGNPEFPALAAAAAHSRGLATRDASPLAEAAARHPDPWARASAAEDLAVLLTGTAKDEAINELKHALDGYGQTGAERDQARIRRRLRALGIRGRHWTSLPDRPVTGWDSLTETEQAIARLVAEGLNNGQVASRVYISTHTVAHHLRRSFRKLHIASRVELARIVIEEATAGP